MFNRCRSFAFSIHSSRTPLVSISTTTILNSAIHNCIHLIASIIPFSHFCSCSWPLRLWFVRLLRRVLFLPLESVLRHMSSWHSLLRLPGQLVL
jgi:hypothetical protein